MSMESEEASLRARVDKMKAPQAKHTPGWKQAYRFQVYVSMMVKRQLEPLARARAMSSTLLAEACDLTLLEALRLVDEESRAAHRGRVRGNGEIEHAILWVTPNDAIYRKAATFPVPPQLLIRAAAVKVGRRLAEQGAVERENERLTAKYGPPKTELAEPHAP